MAVLTKDDATLEPPLDRARHIKYWTRCLKTFLPHQYTSNDSNRMYLAFFIIAALDLLDALNTVSTEQERRDYVDWIYRNQHPNGGFRMWPGTDLGEYKTEDNANWDPANMPATYFALAALLILNDDFRRVRRRETLEWIRNMQRSDGSFAETLVHGLHEGGRDPRFSYCAAGVRYMLRGFSEGPLTIDGQEVKDIDMNKLVNSVRLAESYEGGIADQPFNEPHAGYTFCSLGAMALIGRLNTSDEPNDNATCPSHPEQVLSWLVYRQTELTDPDAAVDSKFTNPSNPAGDSIPEIDCIKSAPNAPPLAVQQTLANSVGVSIFDLLVDGAGMSGRTNKVADTCYAFWVCASLHMMGQPELYDRQALRRYLLGKTQHSVLGGHGKFPGDLPDLLHSYLGLAGLSLSGADGVKELDAAMCLSKEARARLDGVWKEWSA